MTELAPQYAAELANDIYVVKSALTRGDFKAVYEDDMELDEFDKAESSTTLTGTTGAFTFIKQPHVMGVTALGKGKYKNQAFVVLKGTASLLDGLTDANAGVRMFYNGGYVHQGFYYTFDSYLLQLKQFIKGLVGKQITTIHCIGHSLGGALATLSAEWIRIQLNTTVKLYTFGSPRVGLPHFADQLTTGVGSANIYRVYHRTDPVPMVPTWPFTHVPNSEDDCLIDTPASLIPWHYHGMAQYITSTKGKQWLDLKGNRPKGALEKSVEDWLKSDGLLSFTANTLDMLNEALWYVVKKIIKAAGIVLVGGFATTFTLLDRLAYLMSRAFDVGKELSAWVVYLIKKMAQLIGIVVTESTNLTHQFIRYVFLRVNGKVSAMIREAGKMLS